MKRIISKNRIFDLLLPIVFTFLIGITLFISVKNIVISKTIKENETRLYQIRDSFEIELLSKINTIISLSILPDVIDITKILAQLDSSDKFKPKETRKVQNILNNFSKIENNNVIRIISTYSNNSLVSNSEQYKNNIDFRYTDWFRGTSSTEATYVSEKIYTDKSGNEYLVIAYPIFYQSIAIGCVAIEIPKTEIFRILRDSSIKHNVETSVISEKSGNVLWTYNDKGLLINNISDLNIALEPIYGDSYIRIIKGIKSFLPQQFEGVYNGSRRLYQSAPISLLAWDIIISTNKSQVVNTVYLIIVVPFIIAMFLLIIIITITAKKWVLEIKSHELESIKNSQSITLEILGMVSEINDKDTSNHLKRVEIIIGELTLLLKSHKDYSSHITDKYINDIRSAAFLHDIGKIGISDSILNKVGKLTKEEVIKMKEHTIIGHQILIKAQKNVKGESIYPLALEIVRHHHERWDGSGYPDKLAGNSIPLSARIMSIVDVYDALISERSYKKAYSHEESIKIISEGSGSQFDPTITEIFLENSKNIFKKIKLYQN